MSIPAGSLECLAAVASADLAANDWLAQCQSGIEATHPAVNAYTLQTSARAQREAEAIDAMRRAGRALPPLAGLPYAVKNLFDIEGEVTLAGSKIRRHAAAARSDAVLVERLRSAGAVLTGALNMDEFAYGFTTENSHYGPTRNPHDLTRIAGGSSGGSGAAVAAGLVPVALGSDTNGSIRVPASLCGVWGLKPTFGRLSRRGAYPFVHNLDHVGPLADSAQLLALVYDALQGPDPQDPACLATTVQPVGAALGQGLDGLRVGVLGGYFEDNAYDSARQAVAMVAERLGALPGRVQWPEAERARAAAFIVTASEGGSLHLAELRTRAADFEPVSVDRFIAGALQPAHWYARAQRFRRAYRDAVNQLFRHWDVLLAPATPCEATPIGQPWLKLNGVPQPTRASMGMLAQPISFAGCPVVVAPTWPDAAGGLPVGVQLIAAPWREGLALRAAHWLDRLDDDGIGVRPAALAAVHGA
ncbi:AtzE family amidohydrolase [Corticibacter populi]|uniref:AtzE family amidohydrolase n=1 Tax=Corticibacter populi TaxID=1550736 RepID=A0A3M6QQJ6_9BURK|nr:AtzE family amidohydrolase [Corticibacter populi]RMX04819.1 AtzE family amidohydrolase [Corticibacter populi]RZS33763.1 amidase/aspartyl-tRNA(Asn)/glutamyl-tRNA(Gln) amidotransferase subunit A [Corticibacter populi]